MFALHSLQYYYDGGNPLSKTICFVFLFTNNMINIYSYHSNGNSRIINWQKFKGESCRFLEAETPTRWRLDRRRDENCCCLNANNFSVTIVETRRRTLQHNRDLETLEQRQVRKRTNNTGEVIEAVLGKSNTIQSLLTALSTVAALSSSSCVSSTLLSEVQTYHRRTRVH